MTVGSLRSVDLSLIDEIFRGGERGYILDFSNRTFSDFFIRELDIDIDAPQYAVDGISKGKRLRCFLGQVDDGTAARTLRVLWEHREALRGTDTVDPMPRAASQTAALIARLEGAASPTPVNVVVAPILEAIDFDRLRDRLVGIRDTEPHQRGFAFERFLTEVFDAFRLNPREPFRMLREQMNVVSTRAAHKTGVQRQLHELIQAQLDHLATSEQDILGAVRGELECAVRSDGQLGHALPRFPFDPYAFCATAEAAMRLATGLQRGVIDEHSYAADVPPS